MEAIRERDETVKWICIEEEMKEGSRKMSKKVTDCDLTKRVTGYGFLVVK